MALAFLAGIGAHGWVGIYFIASAEAGGPRQSGLLSGVAFAAIVVGLIVGAPVFGLVLEARDSYSAAWAVFAALCALVALLMALADTHDSPSSPRGRMMRAMASVSRSHLEFSAVNFLRPLAVKL